MNFRFYPEIYFTSIFEIKIYEKKFHDNKLIVFAWRENNLEEGRDIKGKWNLRVPSDSQDNIQPRQPGS